MREMFYDVTKTKRRLGEDFREHLRPVRINDLTSEVAIHFNTCGHDIDDMRITVLKMFRTDPERKQFELVMVQLNHMV